MAAVLPRTNRFIDTHAIDTTQECESRQTSISFFLLFSSLSYSSPLLFLYPFLSVFGWWKGVEGDRVLKFRSENTRTPVFLSFLSNFKMCISSSRLLVKYDVLPRYEVNIQTGGDFRAIPLKRARFVMKNSCMCVRVSVCRWPSQGAS